MPVDYDVVIIGAGLSGLSLASLLTENSWADRRVLVVDDGRHDVRGRAWAYWTREPTGLSSAASALTVTNSTFEAPPSRVWRWSCRRSPLIATYR